MSLKSILFVPANRLDLVTKACAGKASAICVDLEDSIAPEGKASARQSVPEAISLIRESGKTSVVRLNSETHLLADDLAVVEAGLDFVVLPKAATSSQINQLAETLDHRFTNEGPQIICLVEAGADLDSLRQTSEELHKRVHALALGTEDLAVDFSTTPNSPVVEQCFYELAILCRRWNLLLLGYPGTIAEFVDLEKYAAKVELGPLSGASGGFCIHPKQVDVLNVAFTPSDEEVEKAKRIVVAFDEAMKDGAGVCSLDGKMIDRPVYLNARALLTRTS